MGGRRIRSRRRGNSLRFEFRQKLGVGSMVMDFWREGVRLAITSQPPPAVFPDYPSVFEDREGAASELDRLAPPGKVNWYNDGSSPPDLCVCPSDLIAKRDMVGAGHDWPSHQYPLNSILVNPPAEYGAMDGPRVVNAGHQ